MNRTSRYIRSLFSIGVIAVCGACSTTQVSGEDPDEFAAKGFKTYGWKFEPVMMAPTGDGSALGVGRVFHEEVDRALSALGYREVPHGGDFLINLQFRTTVEEGAKPRSETSTSAARVAANRGPDPGSIDNAEALSGPRLMSNALLQFENADDAEVLWQAMMSRVIEDVNPTRVDAEAVRGAIRSAVRRATQRLPKATP